MSSLTLIISWFLKSIVTSLLVFCWENWNCYVKHIVCQNLTSLSQIFLCLCAVTIWAFRLRKHLQQELGPVHTESTQRWGWSREKPLTSCASFLLPLFCSSYPGLSRGFSSQGHPPGLFQGLEKVSECRHHPAHPSSSAPQACVCSKSTIKFQLHVSVLSLL